MVAVNTETKSVWMIATTSQHPHSTHPASLLSRCSSCHTQAHIHMPARTSGAATLTCFDKAGCEREKKGVSEGGMGRQGRREERKERQMVKVYELAV